MQGEHSPIRLTFIKLPFVIKIFVLSNLEWPLHRFYYNYILYDRLEGIFRLNISDCFKSTMLTQE